MLRKRKKFFKKYKKRLGSYRQKYRIQVLVSCVLFFVVLALTLQWPVLLAAPQTDDIVITSSSQFGLGTLDDIVVVGDNIEIDGDGGVDWYSDYQYKMKAVFDASSLSANVSSIPIMIHIDNGVGFNDFWSNIVDTTNGYDVVFTDSDSSLLDFHLESFDYASSDLVAWVEVPVLENNTTDYIYTYYGKSGFSNLQDKEGTYSSEYGMVQHLDESPVNDVLGHYDSTANNHDGTPKSFNSTASSNTDTSGMIGGGDIFDGIDDYVLLENSNVIVGDNLEDITVSTWVNYTYDSSSMYAFSLKRSSSASSLFSIVANSSTSNNNASGYLGFLTSVESGSSHSFITHKLGAGYNDGNWHQVVGVVDGLNKYLYIDGILRNSDSLGMQNVTGSTFPATIGSFSGTSQLAFHGKVDEVKVLTEAQSSDWVTATYLSESEALIDSWGTAESILKSPGIYTSHNMDLEKIYAWGDCAGGCDGSSPAFTANIVCPANTSVKFEINSSLDGSVWSGWDVIDTYTTSGTKIKTRDQLVALIGNTFDRYIKVRATLDSTDSVSNPTVSDYRLDYSKDIDEPTNPDTPTGYSEDGGDSLVSGNWYSHLEPYFEWSGAIDVDSGITGGYSGYWICFDDASCDPLTGSFVTEADYTASLLTSNQIYYLRIKAQDAAGNVASSSYDAFTYKYDGTDPVNPSGILPDPAGFSNNNSFAFTWNNGTDTAGSGIAEYCYKTGEVGSTDTCIPGTTVSGVQAYQEGSNTFYVRSKDAVGNLPDFYISVYYYYSINSPSEPQGLSVTPTTNTDNSFAFDWYEPATYSNPIAGYYYSVNAIPSVDNATWTTNTSLSAGPFATQQGTNIFYVVAKDSADNIEWDSYSSIEFNASTTAPGIPQSTLVTDSSIREQSRYMLTLTWAEPANVGSGIDHYIVERSTDNDCENGSGTFTQYATIESLGYLDSGLDNLTRYCYRVSTSDNAGAVSAASSIVSFIPEGRFTEPPAVIVSPVVESRIQSAVVTWQTDRNSSSFVEYGLTSSLGEETGLDNFVEEHEVTLLGLEPDTTYYYRVKYIDQDSNIGYSVIDTFITSDAPSAPIGLTVTPGSNTLNSFAFSWSTPIDEGVNIEGYYYSINSAPTANNVSFTENSMLISGPYATRQGVNTFYVIAVDDAGHLNYDNYAEVDFEASTQAPTIPVGLVITDSSNREQKIYSNTLVWQKATEAGVVYSIERSIGLAGNFEKIAETESFGYLDIGLENTLDYYYRVVAIDSAGAASAYSSTVNQQPEGKYRTPPEITEDPQVTPDSYSAGIIWRTERKADTHIEFGKTEALGEEQGSLELVEGHEFVITGLDSETLFYYKVKSQDEDNNIAYSAVSSFTTVEAPQVANVVITDTGMFDAQISWETNKDTTTKLEYGTTKNYGAEVYDATGSFSKTHTVNITGLLDGTTYHFRPTGIDEKDNAVSTSDYVLTTRPMPKIDDIIVTNVSEGQTRVIWITNVPTTSYVEYYTEDISPKTQGQSELTKLHDVLLYGLTANIEYSYKIHSSDQYGFEVVSNEDFFTTQIDNTDPEIFDVQAESNILGSGEEARVQLLISWKTDEPTTSQVQLAQGFDANEFVVATDTSSELVFEHLEVIQDLEQASNYRFNVISQDKAGNQTTSEAYTVLTSKKRQSVLDIIITNISKRFSWLTND